MKRKVLCPIAAVLVLSPIGAATAQTLPLKGPSIFQSADYGAYPLTLITDPKICLTRTSNGAKECRTRDQWARIADTLSKKQRDR